MSPQGYRKLLYSSLLVLIVLLALLSLWYYRNGVSISTHEHLRPYEAPLWYNIISTGNIGATTGFKVRLHRFRGYKGSLTLKDPPLNSHTDGLTTDKCTGLTKWAVITTIAPETTKTMIVLLDSMPDYCLLVVGDRKSPDSYQLKSHKDRFVYLTIEDQIALPLEIVPLTPENSFSRKNIGFLYAIANGAQVILDMDDDNVPIELNGKFIPIEEKAGSFLSPVVDVEAEGHVWNPYPYYGAKEAWPRGFPLDRIVPLDRKLKTRHVKCLPVVQQFMANRDPDVDAIYRLSHPLPMDFNSATQRMVLPHGVYVPYNAQATIHLHQAFWSMLLPKTVNGRVSDIWRSYISQHLMSFTPDFCLMFAPPAVRHERNSHNYIQDFYSELPLYMMASKLVDMLATCTAQSAPFQEVYRDTYLLFYEMGLLEEADMDYVIGWINDLNRIGYKFPMF